MLKENSQVSDVLLKLNFGDPRGEIRWRQHTNMECLLGALDYNPGAEGAYRYAISDFTLNERYNKKSSVLTNSDLLNEMLTIGSDEDLSIIIYVDPYDRMLATPFDIGDWLTLLKAHVANHKNHSVILIVNSIPDMQNGVSEEQIINADVRGEAEKLVRTWLKSRDFVARKFSSDRKRRIIFYGYYDEGRQPISAAKSSYALKRDNYYKKFDDRRMDPGYQFLTTIWCMNVTGGSKRQKNAGCSDFDSNLNLESRERINVLENPGSRNRTYMHIYVLPPSSRNNREKMVLNSFEDELGEFFETESD